MAAYINTGVYLRILSDELRYNLETQLKENGHADISPSHGWIFYKAMRRMLEVNTSGQQVIPGWPFFYYI